MVISVGLTVIRHGETLYNRNGVIQGQIDIELSDKGKDQARTLGQFISKNQRRSRENNQAMRFIEAPNVIFASPLARAKETATLARKEAGWNLPIIDSDLLKEICFGRCEGFEYTHILEKITADPEIQAEIKVSSVQEFRLDSVTNWGKVGDFWKKHTDHKINDLNEEKRYKAPSSMIMETPNDILDRAKEFIQYLGNYIESNFEEEDGVVHVVVVSHGFFLKVLLSHIIHSTPTGCNDENKPLPFDLMNTSVSMVRFDLHKNSENDQYLIKEPKLRALNSVPHLLC